MPKTREQRVLVTGGAGYIGSHTTLALIEAGHAVVVLDDLSTGSRGDVPSGTAFIEGNVADGPLVAGVLAQHRIESVVHFAGSIRVEESIGDPLKYYRNNTCASRAFIEACAAASIKSFIFSSSAAVYGDAGAGPIGEDAPVGPINPYGWSKVMTERILRDVAASMPGRLGIGILRYFNVAGADPSGRAGQRSAIATHLIKIACEVATGKRPGMQIFGADYPTPDGTCIRDYIHVSDLADAHVRVLEHLDGKPVVEVLNCGYGHGYSVKEVVAAVEAVSGRSIDAPVAARRPGDCAVLVADSARLRQRTCWRPRYDDLATIIRTALDWEKKIAG
jgi:UDP-glucose 4-epimerase